MPTHALDPLTPAEIRDAARLVREAGHASAEARFVDISLREPAKAAVLAGDQPPREASIALIEPAERRLFEGVVSLDRAEVASWREVPGARSPILPDEYPRLVESLKADGRYREALARRGVEDLALVSIDAIPSGHWGQEEDGLGRRFVRALSWVRPEPEGSGYARPVENLVAFVDLDSFEVFRVDDGEALPLPPGDGEYRAGRVGPIREDLRALDIVQPDGPSFEVDGREIRWQRWRFRVGFTGREGLVLHLVRYEDDGRERLVLYRASYTELAVPYGHPGATRYHQCVLDLGEQRFGALANQLELGCDCLGEIRYLDAVLSDAAGEPLLLRNAICLHEEDVGLLWKHADVRAGRTEARRSRRLAISWIATTGNYEYAFYWYLYQDGSIESEVKLTGILQTAVLAPGEEASHGELVAPSLNGMNHQHIFSVRLDLDVDGPINSVHEVESELVPTGNGNPWGNAFVARSTPLRSELEARRLIEPLRGRYWTVANPAVHNGLGRPVAYKLVPGDNVAPYYDERSGFGRRTGFTRYHLWVTEYDPAQRYATGEWPIQNEDDAGLPVYAAGDRTLVERDLVLWYTLAHHHIPRPEDWPVMPVARLGFALRPVGFFDRNPALDVPPPASHCH